MDYREPEIILDVGKETIFFRVLWSPEVIECWKNAEYTHEHKNGIEPGVCAFADPFNLMVHVFTDPFRDSHHYVKFRGRVIKYLGQDQGEPGAYVVDVTNPGRRSSSYQEILNELSDEDRLHFTI